MTKRWSRDILSAPEDSVHGMKSVRDKDPQSATFRRKWLNLGEDVSTRLVMIFSYDIHTTIGIAIIYARSFLGKKLDGYG